MIVLNGFVMFISGGMHWCILFVCTSYFCLLIRLHLVYVKSAHTFERYKNASVPSDVKIIGTKLISRQLLFFQS